MLSEHHSASSLTWHNRTAPDAFPPAPGSNHDALSPFLQPTFVFVGFVLWLGFFPPYKEEKRGMPMGLNTETAE